MTPENCIRAVVSMMDRDVSAACFFATLPRVGEKLHLTEVAGFNGWYDVRLVTHQYVEGRQPVIAPEIGVVPVVNPWEAV